MTQAYVNHVKKYTPLLRSPTYNLAAAADYLEAWVEQRVPDEPMLDVSACSVGSSRSLVPRQGLELDDPTDDPMSLEPPLGEVTLRRTRVAHGCPSDRAVLVYGCATQLVEQHGMSIPDAILIGERCWDSLRNVRTSGAAADIRGDVEDDAVGDAPAIDIDRRSLDAGGGAIQRE